MEVNLINQTAQPQWRRYRKDFIAIAHRCEQVLKLDEHFCVAVIFVTADQIHTINRDYRNIDRPTDVISFALHDRADDYEMIEGEEELGDIFINVQAVIDQAAAFGHSRRREVCFLFTHGLLHLCGYDHMTKQEEAAMFHLQDVILDEIVPKKNHR